MPQLGRPSGPEVMLPAAAPSHALTEMRLSHTLLSLGPLDEAARWKPDGATGSYCRQSRHGLRCNAGSLIDRSQPCVNCHVLSRSNRRWPGCNAGGRIIILISSGPVGEDAATDWLIYPVAWWEAEVVAEKYSWDLCVCVWVYTAVCH